MALIQLRHTINTCAVSLKRLVMLLVLLAIFNVPGAFAEWHSDTQGIMGTEVSVTLWHEDTELGRHAIAAVMEEMHRIDATLSPYIDDSALATVNRLAAKEAQILSPEFASLIDKSLWFSKISDGAFDITFASLARYYNYREATGPSEAEREAALPAINYRWLDFDKQTRRLSYRHAKVKIDLGGIAKGYATDRAIAILKSLGVRYASVSAGGDSRLLGDRRGRPWIVGIKNPRAAPDSGEAVIRIPLNDIAVSTSGDYERYFIDEASGERIHHILNPKTGRSANTVMSVTILGDQGLNTDPLSTTVFVLGVDKGLALVNGLAGYDAIIIDIHGKVHYSEGLTAPSP